MDMGYCKEAGYWTHNMEYCLECNGDSNWCIRVNYQFPTKVINKKYCRHWTRNRRASK